MSGGRLPPGELKARVRTHLQERPGGWSVTQITSALNASSTGAVGNACKSLTRDGVVRAEGSRPVRYCFITSASSHRAGSKTPVPSVSTPRSGGGTAGAGNTNRGVYRPRSLAGHADIEVLQQLRTAQLPVLLAGPPGTGKTALAEGAFGAELITVAGDADITADDIVGGYAPGDTPGSYRWEAGPLVQAMRTGAVLLVDDITLIPAPVLGVVYPAMDGRGRIRVKDTGALVDAAPGFFIIGGYNPGAEGATLSKALASRFTVHIEVGLDLQVAGDLGIDADVIRIAAILRDLASAAQIGWCPAMRELQTFQRLADVLGKQAALGNLIGAAPEDDRAAVAKVVSDVMGRRIKPLTLGGRHR